MHRALRATLQALPILALAAGCSGFGQYLTARARDFGDCWRAEAGEVRGFSLSARGGGIVDLGLGWVVGETAGWTYGRWSSAGTFIDQSGSEQWFPLTPSGTGLHAYVGAESQEHDCWWLMPALLARTSTPSGMKWIWVASGPDGRWARVHAFDVEIAVHLFVGGVRLGFSPGELLDFALGWFGLDIAGDDRRE